MKPDTEQTVYYKRSRFSTRLPVGRRYTLSHYWLFEEDPGTWRVGFTKFATRMLGDLVECEFSASSGGKVQLGEKIGWVEGFKAITDLYSVATGEFLGSSPELAADITRVETDPYGSGWLYQVRGEPDPGSVDVHGYQVFLDATIDKMMASRHTEAHGGENV
jgi:glycine cleavage system H protein